MNHPGRNLDRPLLGALLLLFAAPCVHAQSPDHVPNCPLTQDQRALLRHLSHQDERPPIIVDAVEFNGASHLSDSGLQKLVSELRETDRFSLSNWGDEATEMARFAWQDEGFFYAETEATTQGLRRDELGDHYKLTIRIKEGLKYRLRNIQFRSAAHRDVDADMPTLRRRVDPAASEPGSPEPEAVEAEATAPLDTFLVPPDRLRKLIQLRDGDIFLVGKVRDGLEAMKELYASNGYIDFTARPQTSVDEADQTILLTLELDAGDQYRMGVLEVLGAEPEMERLLRSTFQSRAIFNSQAVRDFFKANQGRLPPGGWERRVDLDRDKVLRTVNLRIDLRPCPDLGN